MDLQTYAAKLGGTGKIGCPVFAAVAKRASCSPATLYMVSRGNKRAGPKLARAIETATSGEVTAAEIRPDYFGPLQKRRKAA
ncbi:MAG TPA: YdaS family helix-turn-helix protein [Gemmatimonadaceae bacterium]